MIFDTDIIIWTQRANKKAAQLIDQTDLRYISIQTFMELLQRPLSKKQQNDMKSFLQDYSFHILPLTENIGHRAAIYIEEYSPATGIEVGDAIIAATAVENNFVLATSNKKHFQSIQNLTINIFKP